MSTNDHIAHDPDGQLSLGQPAPEFSLPNVIDGKPCALNDIREKAKAVVVIFSCNHCPWVIKYEEKLTTLGSEYQSKGVAFFVISSNDVAKFPQDGPVAMKERAIQKGYPFPYLYDESQEIAHTYGAQVTPHIFVFDGDLILRYRGAIDDNPDREPRPVKDYLRDALDAILTGNLSAISASSTRAMGCSVKWR